MNDRTLFEAELDALRAREKAHTREGDRVFETYWTTRRGVETMDYSYALMDLTAYGRQEAWEDSPDGSPRGGDMRVDGRPIAQWSRC